MMVKYLVEGTIYWINGVENTIGTEVIIPGRHQHDFNFKKIAFRAYEISYVKTKDYITARVVP